MPTARPPAVLHLHTHFLPDTEHWAHLLSGATPGFVHLAAAEQGLSKPPASGRHVAPLRHGLESLNRWRLHRWRPLRAAAAAALALRGGTPRAIAGAVSELANGPAIVHAHFGDIGCRLGSEVAERLGLPLVVSFYGWDLRMIPAAHPTYRERYRRLFATQALLLSTSPGSTEELLTLGARAEQIRLISCGTAVPDAIDRSGADEDALLQLARFTPKKGQHITLAAFERIAEEFPDATLAFIGGADDRDYFRRVQRAIAVSPVRGRISYSPGILPDEIPSVLAKVGVSCQPSLVSPDGDIEGGSPVAVQQSHANGVPAAVTDHLDMPSFIPDLGWNRPVPEDSAGAYADLLRRALSRTSEQRRSDSQTVRTFVAERYSVAASGRALAQVYREAIARHSNYAP